MENVIEVGDILHHAFLKKDYTVSGVNSNKQVQLAGLSGWNEPEWVAKYMTIKTKGVKQDIVGYELLKDLPGITVGTKSSEFMGLGRGGVVFTGVTSFDVSDKLLQDTTWFKPIYKAEEIVVKISDNREVTITDNKVIFDKYTFTFYDITKINNILNPPVVVGEFKVDIKIISIGCKGFLKQDIERVYQAIQNIK